MLSVEKTKIKNKEKRDGEWPNSKNPSFISTAALLLITLASRCHLSSYTYFEYKPASEVNNGAI